MHETPRYDDVLQSLFINTLIDIGNLAADGTKLSTSYEYKTVVEKLEIARIDSSYHFCLTQELTSDVAYRTVLTVFLNEDHLIVGDGFNDYEGAVAYERLPRVIDSILSHVRARTEIDIQSLRGEDI